MCGFLKQKVASLETPERKLSDIMAEFFAASSMDKAGVFGLMENLGV